MHARGGQAGLEVLGRGDVRVCDYVDLPLPEVTLDSDGHSRHDVVAATRAFLDELTGRGLGDRAHQLIPQLPVACRHAPQEAPGRDR